MRLRSKFSFLPHCTFTHGICGPSSRLNNGRIARRAAANEARASGRIFFQVVKIARETLPLKDPRVVPPMKLKEEELEEEDEEEEESRSILEYQDSDSPSEYWDEDQEEWPIKGIVGEEVTTAGELKSVALLSSKVPMLIYCNRYEVSWKPWERADGSCTLWMRDIPDRPDLVRAWKQKQKKKRRKLADYNLDIEVTNDIDIHNLLTLRRSQAYDEKLEKRKKNPINYKNWDLLLDRNLLNKEKDAPRSLRMGSDRGGTSSISSSSHTQTLRASTTLSSISSRPPASATVSSTSSRPTTVSSISSRPPASTSIPLKPTSLCTTSAPIRISPRPLPQRAGKGKGRVVEVFIPNPPSRSVLILPVGHFLRPHMFIYMIYSGERNSNNHGIRSQQILEPPQYTLSTMSTTKRSHLWPRTLNTLSKATYSESS